MAQHIAVMGGGSKGSGAKPVARIKYDGRVVNLMPGGIRKDITLPAEVWRSGPTTVRITNTTIHPIRVGSAHVAVGKSHVPASQVWVKVEQA